MRSAQERFFDDEIRIEERTQGSFDAATFKHNKSVNRIYEGPASITQAGDPADPEIIVEGFRTLRNWIVAIPNSVADAREGHVVVVVSARDMWLPRELVVTEVTGGGYGSRRRLVCKELQP